MEKVVVFVRVVETAEEIEGRVVVLDCMVTKAAAKYRTQIQCLQFIGEEVGSNESKNLLCHVMVISGATGPGIGYCRRHCTWSVVLAVNRVGIEAEFVVRRLPRAQKSNGKVRGFAVAAREREADVQTRLPRLEQPGMQGLLIRSLLRIVAQVLHLGPSRINLARGGRNLQFAV